MARHLTPEEVRNDCITTMGAELGELYHQLSDELTWLHIKWQQYRDLFGKDAERVDILNRAAPLFFGHLQTTLFEDVLLHLARLTDRPKTGKQENLTVRRIPSLIQDAVLRTEIEALLDVTLSSCTLARDWRNRRLAHTDLATSREQHPVPLSAASRQSVRVALKAMSDLLNHLAGHFQDSEVAYELTFEPGGADDLVYYLDCGLKASEEKP